MPSSKNNYVCPPELRKWIKLTNLLPSSTIKKEGQGELSKLEDKLYQIAIKFKSEPSKLLEDLTGLLNEEVISYCFPKSIYRPDKDKDSETFIRNIGELFGCARTLRLIAKRTNKDRQPRKTDQIFNLNITDVILGNSLKDIKRLKKLITLDGKTNNINKTQLLGSKKLLIPSIDYLPDEEEEKASFQSIPYIASFGTFEALKLTSNNFGKFLNENEINPLNLRICLNPNCSKVFWAGFEKQLHCQRSCGREGSNKDYWKENKDQINANRRRNRKNKNKREQTNGTL